MANKLSGFLVASLSKVTGGTMVFLLNLSMMLYASLFFLVIGPVIATLFITVWTTYGQQLREA